MPVLLLLAGTFLALALATYFNYVEVNGLRQISLSDFEIGKVADRDVVAGREISYVDENSTKIRRDARQRLVTAVFRHERVLSENMLAEFIVFTDFLERLYGKSAGAEQFVLELQQAYPGTFDKKQMEGLYRIADKSSLVSAARMVFKQIVNEGITVFPDEGMDRFNQTDVEIVRWKGDRQERLEAPKGSLLTFEELRPWISNSLALMKRGQGMTDSVLTVVRPFLKENLIYQSDESEAKLEEAARQVPPVLVVLQKGQKIIKRGFLITEESYQQLEALVFSGVYINTRQFVGALLFLALLMALALYAFSAGVIGYGLDFGKIILLVISFSFLYFIALFFGKIQNFSLQLDLAVVVPAAMITMLITVLIDQRTAFVLSVMSALGVLCASGFFLGPAVFTLLSGIAGVSVMRITGKRIDLVKSAGILALINPLLIFVLSIVLPGSVKELTATLAGAAANGFMSGVLVLGFLPILESVMNSATSFRLMEFSDLNSPIMKRMLLSVSGTYNHSIMVATLAESACREIGANPLLARVGSYYHDIGKMDQSEYFVENQTDYNKHLDLNPRLSATVIRSHVKQGIEKARQMRLPKEVIDVISEHHGNSLISYFYNEAKKRDEDVNPEDFMYPGTPPRTRESAVVMLADVVEAACRTLDKPSVPRLEKFINELVARKIEDKQLDDSELTFRDIGIIKKSFLNILAGYYHSRIEYPNQKDPDMRETVSKEHVAKGKKNEQ